MNTLLLSCACLLNNSYISGDGYVICDDKNINLIILCVYTVTTFEIILSWHSVDCNQNRLLLPRKSGYVVP